MKKSKLTKIIAVILTLTLAFSSFGAVTASASSAYPITGSDNPIGVIFSDIIDTLLRFVLDMFASLFPNGPGFVEEEDVNVDLIDKNFYIGTVEKDKNDENAKVQFNTTAKENAQWHIGYSNASLIPSDYSNGTYYLGGYISLENGFTNVVEGIATIPGIGLDDMKVRCVSMKDHADSDTVLFATIDCIGITNADIKDIRAKFEELAVQNGIDLDTIGAINVSSTHTHSCIDTEGLWTKNLVKLASNGIISGTGSQGELQQGTNPAYMAFLKDEVACALLSSYFDMKEGTLTISTKDIGEDYFNNKNRPTSGQLTDFDESGNVIVDGARKIAMTEITRFMFTPDQDKYPEARETMMINMAAHPDVAGLPTSSNSGREISGDYLFYCGYFLDKYADINFMFFQGAIAGIYMGRSVIGDGVETYQRVEESQRFGFELARMALSMNLTEEEIVDSSVNEESPYYDYFLINTEEEAEYGENEYYTRWYEDWEPVDVEEVEPILNLYITQVEITVSNALIEAVGKLNMANYVVIANEDGTYSTITEIGYMELGSGNATAPDGTRIAQFNAVFLPGEICQDLIAPYGASLYAQNAVTAQAFKSKAACDIFVNPNIKCFGLMNDAIGYVVPDNDYTMGDPVDHYQELISLGNTIASELMNGLIELENDIEYVA